MSSDPNSSSPESPPPSHWPISLEHLLNSSTGKNLFLEYLRNEDEGLSFPLLFLLAVDGLHGVAEENYEEEEQMINSVKIIYEKLLPSVSCISQRIRETILHNISSSTVSIYDEAVEEVRDHLSRNLYPNFLKSEFYLAAFNHEYGGAAACPVTAEAGPSHQIPVDTDTLVKVEQQENAASYKSRDLQTVHEEEVLSLKRPKPFQLTEEILLSTQRQRAKKGIGVGPLHPYHAQYSSYNPVSRQDSEIQSLSSGCTDESISVQRRPHPRRVMHVDELPPVHKYIPLPKREGYSQYTKAERDPGGFAKEVIKKLELIEQQSTEERLRNLSFNRPSSQHQQHSTDSSLIPPATSRQANQSRVQVKSCFATAVDTRILETHLRKLEESAHSEPIEHLEESEQEGQSILDQHVRRVWDSTTPDFSRSPRNEAVDSRKTRRGHGVPSPVSRSTAAALIKGKSMQTLDSGIGGDKEKLHEHRAYKVRPAPPPPRWSNEQFIDSGMSDAGRSSTWDSEYYGRTVVERLRSVDSGPSRRLPALPPQPQPVPHRRHSPPTEDTVSVLVHHEFEHENPFRIKIAKTKLTLGVLKSKVPKKGNWKYLFKLQDADDRKKQINYELKRDEELLPMFREDCVVVILKSIPPSESTKTVYNKWTC